MYIWLSALYEADLMLKWLNLLLNLFAYINREFLRTGALRLETKVQILPPPPLFGELEVFLCVFKGGVLGGATPGGPWPQGLFLLLLLGITPGAALGTIWGTEDGAQVSHVQDKHRPISWAP